MGCLSPRLTALNQTDSGLVNAEHISQLRAWDLTTEDEQHVFLGQLALTVLAARCLSPLCHLVLLVVLVGAKRKVVRVDASWVVA